MAQGRPPRHSRTDREPVTLDLKAEKSPEENQPEANPSPEKASTPEALAETEATRTDGAPAEANEPPTAMAEAATPQDDAEEEPAREEMRDPDAASAGAGADSDGTAPPPPKSGSAGQRRSPALGIAFAAGVIGGIIVGAIGFGLYYGGILPVPGRSDLQQTQAELSSLGNAVADLKQKVAMLNNAPPPEPQNAGDINDLKAAIGKLDNELNALSGKVSQLEKRVSHASANNVSKAAVGGLNGDVKSLQGAVNGNGKQIEALSRHVDQLSARLAQAGNEAAMIRTVAASSLVAAIERGGAFKPELAAYRSVAPDDPTGAELEKLAAAGVPSRQRLLDEFPKAADAILAATSGAAQSSGIFDRLMASAQSVIKIRPTGNVEGSGPKAIVARMGAGLKEGDLNAVVKEWSSLPESGRNASKAFIGGVNTRLKAETLANEALKHATPGATRRQG